MDPTCSSRGVCVRGECHCSVGWGGTNCETPRATCLDQCSGHGTFLPDTGLCNCDPSWTGHDCSIGKYGRERVWRGFDCYTVWPALRHLTADSSCADSLPLPGPSLLVFDASPLGEQTIDKLYPPLVQPWDSKLYCIGHFRVALIRIIRE